jgi:hypothetical protein
MLKTWQASGKAVLESATAGGGVGWKVKRTRFGGTVAVDGDGACMLCAGCSTVGMEAWLVQGLRWEVEMLSSLSPICSLKWQKLSCKTV